VTPFLITGCGRSGTAWAASLFTALGYPCGHEEAFSRDRDGPLTESEASWLAVPYLDSLPEGTPVLRIMRDPYKVVQSIIAKGFLSRDDDYDKFVARHRPDIVSPSTHLGRAVRYVALWDEPLAGYNVLRAEGSAHVTTGAVRYATGDRVSRSDVGQVCRAVGVEVNATPIEERFAVPTREEIDADPDALLIRMRAERFGYAGG
jgi:hypothetical protein